MSSEKASTWIGIIVFVAAIVAAWVKLDNRLDNMDAKIAGIEKTLGSAACNAILPRQIEAIEKNHKEAREALDSLSKQYDCGPHHAAPAPSPMSEEWANAVMTANTSAEDNLTAQLNSVDVLLNESNASDAHR